MSIGMSIQIYQADNNGQMPPSIGVLAKESYLKIGVGTDGVENNSPVGETVLTCPSRRGDKLMGGDLDGTSSYCYAQPKDPRGISRPGTVPIMWEKAQSHRRGVNVLFADFQAQTEPLATLRDQIEQNSSLYVKPPVLPEAERR
jgi:prepilin-type processing-associated H-X9-DG protein